MDACNIEDAAATLCSLDQQLSLLTAILTTLLLAVLIALAVAAVVGCKGLQEKRSRHWSSSSPAKESSKEREEMVLYSSTTSPAVEPAVLYLSRGLVNCTRSITTTPVQRVSDDKGEMV